jgi:hypothetical protein
VSEKRTKLFAQGLLDRGLSITWHATIEIKQVNQYSDATLDLMRDSGLFIAPTGVESASWEMQESIGKRIKRGGAARNPAWTSAASSRAALHHRFTRRGEGLDARHHCRSERSQDQLQARLGRRLPVPADPRARAVAVTPSTRATSHPRPPPPGARCSVQVDGWKGAIPGRVHHDWAVFSFLAPWADGRLGPPGGEAPARGSARWRVPHRELPAAARVQEAYHRARQLIDRLWTSQRRSLTTALPPAEPPAVDASSSTTPSAAIRACGSRTAQTCSRSSSCTSARRP